MSKYEFNHIALMEYDHKKAMIEPGEHLLIQEGFPERIVLTFFHKEVLKLRDEGVLETIYHLGSEMGNHPVYRFRNTDIGLFPLGVGAPLAAGQLDELIALGGRTFLACGGAGVLVDTDIGSLRVPVEGVRDEGTSFHYVAPSRTISLSPDIVERLTSVLDAIAIPYQTCKTWTTDAFYRETRDKVQTRIQEGCTTVEMEFTALAAVAQYRDVEFAQILYGGDDLSKDIWDNRSWHKRDDVRVNLIQLSKDVLERL